MSSHNEGSPSAHIDNIPTEILSHILVSCHEHNNTPSTSTAPLALTRVSKKWNAVANDLPRLWTDIKLDNDVITDGKGLTSKKFLEQLGRWIKISGNVPISIKFSYLYSSSHSTYEDYCKEMKDIVDLLLTCQNRWHTLKIHVKNFAVVQGLLDAMSNLDNAPQLRKFKLRASNRLNSNCLAWKAWCTGLTLHPKDRHSGYARLTGLELRGSLSKESAMWWIRQAPNLKTLEVCDPEMEIERHQIPPLHVWELKNLSKLSIVVFPSSHIRSLLAQLTFPVLTDLHVNVAWTESSNSALIEDLLSRTKPQDLRKLTLSCFPISETSTLTYLKQSPNLVYLKVSPMTPMILDALTARSGKHPYCPNLEELDAKCFSSDCKKLWDVVHSRLHDTRFNSLKKLTVPSDIPKTQYEALADLGLKVS